jgi:hypothetical protein
MALKFNTDFINLGPLTSTNFGIEPINLSNVGPVAPLSNADLFSISFSCGKFTRTQLIGVADNNPCNDIRI